MVPQVGYILTMERWFHSGMSNQKEQLRKEWNKFKKLPMPPALSDLKEELVILDTYIAGLTSSYLAGDHIRIDDAFLSRTNSSLEEKIARFRPDSADEEKRLSAYRQYKLELDKLVELLYKR